MVQTYHAAAFCPAVPWGKPLRPVPGAAAFGEGNLRQKSGTDLHSPLIAGRRVVDEGPVLPKAGAVAGAVPAVLGGVVAEGAAHMGTAGNRGGQEPQDGLDRKSVV